MFFSIELPKNKDTHWGVVQARFSECMNCLYRLELLVVTDKPDVDISALVMEPITFSFDEGKFKRTVHGLIWETKHIGRLDQGMYGTQFVVRPKFKCLDASISNRVFCDTSRMDAVVAVLENAGFTLDTDFELSLQKKAADHTKIPQVVQYQETDLAFIKRLLEFEGINFYIGIDKADDKLIITDVMSPDCVSEPLPLVPRSQMVASEQRISQFLISSKLGPSSVRISQDSGWDPLKKWEQTTAVSGAGTGEVYLFNHNHNDQNEADRLARIRADELSCRKTLGQGQSNCIAIRPGHRFELKGSHSSGKDGKYLITEVNHTFARHPSSAFGDRNFAFEYNNTFESVSSQVTYRPQRVTPWPRLPGVMHAQIEIPENKNLPCFDENTRYRVKMPFDEQKHELAQGSTDLSLLRPFAASPSQTAPAGFQFPLPDQADIVWAGLDGDPDQPIVLGTLPLENCPSPISKLDKTTPFEISTRAGHSYTLNDWRTPGWNAVEQLSGGEKLEGEDNQPFTGNVKFYSPTDNSELNIGEITKQSGRGRGHKLYTCLTDKDDALKTMSSAQVVMGEMGEESSGQTLGKQTDEGIYLDVMKADPDDDSSKLLTRAILGILGKDGGETFTGALFESLKSESEEKLSSLLFGCLTEDALGITANTSAVNTSLSMQRSDSFYGIASQTEGRSIVTAPKGVFFSAYPDLAAGLGAGGGLADFYGTYNKLIVDGVSTAVSKVKSSLECKDDAGLLALGKTMIKELSSLADSLAAVAKKSSAKQIDDHLGIVSDFGVCLHAADGRLSLHGNKGVNLGSGQMFDAVGKDDVAMIGLTKGVTAISIESDAQLDAIAGDVYLFGEKEAQAVGGDGVLIAAGKISGQTNVEVTKTGVNLFHKIGQTKVAVSDSKIDFGKPAMKVAITADKITCKSKTYSAAGLLGIKVKVSKEIKIG